ncbi:MAG TPA: hypothetical protein PL096_10220 [Micropepsaceae bacterium]|nr:hypothetical protein [Micropepsaceae bacterium]
MIDRRSFERRWGQRLRSRLLAASALVMLPAMPLAHADAVDDRRIEANVMAGAGDCAGAYPLFLSVADETGHARDHLSAATCATTLGQTEDAIAAYYRALAKRDDLSRDEQIYALKALAFEVEKTGRHAEAADAFQQLVALEDTAENRAYLAQASQRAGRTGDEINALEAAVAADPANRANMLNLAYAYRRAGREDDAADMFARAAALDPADTSALEDHAYALRAAGRNAESAAKFREAIDALRASGASDDAAAERLFRMRREVETLERDWSTVAFLSYRSPFGGATSPLPEAGRSVSQFGAEAAWRPPGIGFDAGRIFEVYGRVFGSMEEDSLSPDEDTLQAGFGIRYKPFADHDLRLSLERLVAIGDDARDGWLVRAGYFWGDGVDFEPVKDDWNFTTLSIDAAHIIDDPEYTSLYAEFVQGHRFKLGEASAINPHIVIAGQWQDDQFGSTSRLEGGAGVTVSFWHDEDAYTAPRGRIDLTVEARFGIAGDSDDDSALLARLVFFN